jgi:hypothetical protein
MLSFNRKAFHQFSFSPFLVGYKNCLEAYHNFIQRYKQKYKNFIIFANSFEIV